MSAWYDYRDFHYFPPSRPRQARGGIKAQSRRGAFAESWWGKQWIGVLEGFFSGARLGRGKRYARQGQVLSIEIEKGKVEAKVQGSRPAPYKVTIGVKALGKSEWKKVAAELSSQAAFAAKLLAGEMPADIEKAFEQAGLSLFPRTLRELKTDCSCPDWSNPCKHIAAVYYLLAEEFDRDPFLLFRLRGMTREEMVEHLKTGDGTSLPEEEAGAPPPAQATLPGPEVSKRGLMEPVVAEPLPADPAIFWNGGSLPDGFFGEVLIPPVPAALLKQLRGFPFWRGEVPLAEALAPAYLAASARGLRVFLGEPEAAPP